MALNPSLSASRRWRTQVRRGGISDVRGPSTWSRPAAAFVLSVALCGSLSGGSAHAKATYTTFGVASVNGINATDTVTGVYDNGAGNESFVRTADGTITTFAVPNANVTQAMSINDGSAVAGVYYDSGLEAAHGFVRAADGTMSTFDVRGASETFANGINNKNEIDGYYVDNIGTHHGYVRAAGGEISTFDVPGASSTDPGGINDKGTIVGSYGDANGGLHGFTRAAGGTITTIDVPGAPGTMATAINIKGVVAGWYANVSVLSGFVRTPDGTITTFNDPSCIELIPVGINRKSVVAGWCNLLDNRKRFLGFIWRPGGTIRKFHVPNGGARETMPAGINDTGVIAGSYTFGGFLRIP